MLEGSAILVGPIVGGLCLRCFGRIDHRIVVRTGFTIHQLDNRAGRTKFDLGAVVPLQPEFAGGIGLPDLSELLKVSNNLVDMNGLARAQAPVQPAKRDCHVEVFAMT